MFREMRRARQQLSREESEEILKKGLTGVLSVTGDGGYPYGVPVNYVYADGKIYIHGAKSGHKVDSIRKNDRVSFTVISEDRIVEEELTTYFRSVILFGRARILETDEEKHRAASLLGLKYSQDAGKVEREIEREWKSLCCIEVHPEHITGKEAIELTRARKNT